MLVFVFHHSRSIAYKVIGSVVTKQAQGETTEEGTGHGEWWRHAKDTAVMGAPAGNRVSDLSR